MSTILNLKVTGELFSDIKENVSSSTESSRIALDSVGSSHVLESIRHIGGNRTHHQFFPIGFSNFYF